MRKSWSSLLLLFIAAAVAGCGRGGGPLKKMTAEDARAYLSFEIGEWGGSQVSRGGAFRKINKACSGCSECRTTTVWKCVNKWKEEGRSIQGTVFMKVGILGEVGYGQVMEYDPVKGVIVITRESPLGMTEVFHRSYDPATRKFRGKFINPPGGAEFPGRLGFSLNGRLIGADEVQTVSKTYLNGKLMSSVVLTAKRKKPQ